VGELAADDAVWPGGVDSETVRLVRLLEGDVPLEPVPPGRVFGCSFPREDVRGNPIKEPSVVGGDDRAAGKVQQGGLQRAEGLGVVGLVEQQ
jgi:hypothetical protein